MSKRIKPICRIVRIKAELTRIEGESVSIQQRIPMLDESWIPCVDISERASEIILEVELPGVSREDISISVSGSRIEIKGSKRESKPRKSVKYFRLEREYGPFRRMVSLPGSIIPEKAKAVLEDGVLILTLKKFRTQRKKEKIVPIRRTGDRMEDNNGEAR